MSLDEEFEDLRPCCSEDPEEKPQCFYGSSPHHLEDPSLSELENFSSLKLQVIFYLCQWEGNHLIYKGKSVTKNMHKFQKLVVTMVTQILPNNSLGCK